MRTIGVILIVLGLLGFIVEGISYTTEDVVADVGPVEVEAETQERIPITPLASGGVLVIGIGLFAAGSRNKNATG
jgi:hypothetical protein